MAICILVLDQEEKAYELWEKLQLNKAQITNFKVIEPAFDIKENSKQVNANKRETLPPKVKINEVKLFNSSRLVCQYKSYKFDFKKLFKLSWEYGFYV